MDLPSTPPISFGVKSYYLLAKPGILMGNAITATSAFCLASRTNFDLWLFFATIFGLSFVIGSACVFNNYIDRVADQKMERTKHRALAMGSIPVRRALAFGCLLLTMGLSILGLFTNTLSVFIACFGFIVYVIFYSYSKYYTEHGTLIGSIAGAIPPIVGYSAASHHLDLGGWILFSMLVLWQMPHFYAIAIYRMKDYAAASIPVLPIQRGVYPTKIQMLIYIIAFALVSLLLFAFGYAGAIYLAVSLGTSIVWLGLCIQGLVPNQNFPNTESGQKMACHLLDRLRTISDRDIAWAKKMFRFSLVVITSLSLAIVASFI